MLKSIIVLVIVASVGCEWQTPWPRGTVLTPETNFGEVGTADWTLEVQKAIDLWQEQLGPDCSFPFELGHGGFPVRLVPFSEWAHGDYINGVQGEDYIEIVGGHPYGKEWVLVHELGHALDLWHNYERGTVMFESAGQRFVESEVAEVRAAYCSL